MLYCTNMNNISLPDECCKQWEILLLLISAEEKKIDRTNDSEIDTMNYFLSNEGIRHVLLEWLKQMKESYSKKTEDMDTALKCDNISLQWRLRGNDKFRANLIEESYKCYTKSVIYAYQNGPMYSLALANRSAALLRMKQFQDCLSDIKLAIACGYPKDQRHKLFLRQADCHIAMCQRNEAMDMLTAAVCHSAKLQHSVAYNADFERHVRDLEKKLELISNRDAPEDVVLPELYLGENKNFCSASKAVELRQNDTVGRHVVACRPTRRGDVLFTEEPYACVSLPSVEENATCENCCRTAVNIVPCCVCSRSWYCGEVCRARAACTYHRWECVGTQADLFKTIGIAHLALRVLLMSASEGFPKVPKYSLDPKTADELFRGYANVDNLQIYARDTPAFYRMFNLVTNFDKMNNTDYIQYALTATMLILYLENFTSFFDYLPSRLPNVLSANEMRLFAAALVLRSLGQLVCNGHAALSLIAIEEDDGRTLAEREMRRATAIYPSAAMMNHSCDPNIINTFYNSKLIVRCSRELSEGSEVFNCYGPHRSRETTVHRRSQLRAQYMFNCGCTACTDSDRRDFISLFTAYACQNCKGPVLTSGKRNRCQQCKSEFQLDRAHTIIEKAEEIMLQAENCTSMEERCEKMQASFKLKQQVWHRHHKSLRIMADRLARLYADLGEVCKSVELIKQNIQSLEYQFGSFSVEVAHELRKLSDVMLERLFNTPQNQEYREWCLETHKIIKKAIQLMEMNYGSWEVLVKRLKEQETIVASLLAHSRTPDAVDNIHQTLHYNLKI